MSDIIHTSFDIETTDLDPYSKEGEIFSYCIGDWDLNVKVNRGFINEDLQKRKDLQNYFNDTNKSKICHNYMFELAYCQQQKINIPKKTVWHCTQLMYQILDNKMSGYRLAVLCDELANYTLETPWGTLSGLELDAKVKNQANARGKRYDRVDKRLFHYYQIGDGQMPIILFRFGFPLLQKDELMYKCYLKEIAFAKVCERIQKNGIFLHVKNTKNLRDEMENNLDRVLKEINEIYGEYVNLGSSKVVQKLLYKRLHLPILEYTIADKPQPSTEKEVLFKLQKIYPEHKNIIDLILKHRSYTTGLANTRNYLNLRSEKDFLHPNLNSNKAGTGRISTSKPNLLNVAKEGVKKNPFPVPARSCFGCEKDTVIYLVDYAGIQMRLIAAACGEQEMLDIINIGGDVHKIPTELFYSLHTTKEGLKINSDSLSEKEWKMFRGSGKNCNFAKPFGCGLSAACDILDLPLEIGKPGVELYDQRFPKVANFSRLLMDEVKQYGFVTTYSGRKLNVDRRKPYAGVNYRIQGDESEIMKRACILVDNYFQIRWNDRLKLILNIYDEMIFSCPVKISEQYEDKIMNTVSNLMIGIPDVNVRLDVEWKKTYTTWNKAEEIKLNQIKKKRL